MGFGLGTKSPFFYDNLRAFAFAGAENDGLMRRGLVRGGATAMGVTVKVEFPLAESGPQQPQRSQGHDDQGNHRLPLRIHNSNIGGPARLAMVFSTLHECVLVECV